MSEQNLTQEAVGKRAGLVQRTVGGYLALKSPSNTVRGKEKSAKLSELGMIADALGIAPWQLLVPVDEQQDELLERRAAELRDLFLGMSERARQQILSDARKLYAVTREQSGERRDRTKEKQATGTHGPSSPPLDSIA